MPKFDKYNAIDYLEDVLRKSSLRGIIRKYRTILKKENFTHIAVSGVSGLSIGPIVAYLMGKELIVVRKGEQSHSCHTVESISHSDRKFNYIIVDDLVDSGKTVNRIYNNIKDKYANAELTGIYTYGSSFVLKVNVKRVIEDKIIEEKFFDIIKV